MTVLDNSPIVADYFEDFFPHDLNDVKKQFQIPMEIFFFLSHWKPFAIFVRAQRAVLDKTETYCWLVDHRPAQKPRRFY